jgi:hypothetical protein
MKQQQWKNSSHGTLNTNNRSGSARKKLNAKEEAEETQRISAAKEDRHRTARVLKANSHPRPSNESIPPFMAGFFLAQMTRMKNKDFTDRITDFADVVFWISRMVTIL